MTKRRLAWCAVVCFTLIAIVVGVFGLSGVRTVRIDGAEIQKRIEAQLPKSYKNVKLTRAVVTLKEGDMAIALTLEGSVLGQSFVLEANGVGVPMYLKEREAFYFSPSELTVSKLELSGKSVVDRVGTFADRYVTNPKLKENIVATLPGVQRWVEDNFESHVLATLGNIPLYSPKNDMKGIVLKATLQDLKVENGTITLSFSLIELTKTVLFCVFLLIVAMVMVGGMIMFPEWGLVMLAVGSIGS